MQADRTANPHLNEVKKIYQPVLFGEFDLASKRLQVSNKYNFKSTRSVTLEMMIEHSRSARQGIPNSLMIVDMPYNTYNNPTQALKNCKKVMKLTKCDGVKLEGGLKIIKIVKKMKYVCTI